VQRFDETRAMILGMTLIRLPQTLAHYFAFAEMEPRGNARRFTITLPYFKEGKLDRIQWWWRINDAELKIIGEEGLAARRTREIQRFVTHVERWLANNRQQLIGDGPIPMLEPLAIETAAATDLDAGSESATEVSPHWEPTRAAAG
jgi:hypothetical protein